MDIMLPEIAIIWKVQYVQIVSFRREGTKLSNRCCLSIGDESAAANGDHDVRPELLQRGGPERSRPSARRRS